MSINWDIEAFQRLIRNGKCYLDGCSQALQELLQEGTSSYAAPGSAPPDVDGPRPGPSDVEGVVGVAPGRPPGVPGRRAPVPAAAVGAVHGHGRRGRVVRPSRGGEDVLDQLPEVAASAYHVRRNGAPDGGL